MDSKQLPFVSPGVPATLSHGVLSQEECLALIAGVPASGPGHMSGDRVSELYRDRVLEQRFMSHDTRLAQTLFERLQYILPKELDGGRLLRLNPHFRFIHYAAGGKHAMHIDGREPGTPEFDETARGWIQSRLTLQVYLSSSGQDFEGGQLVFILPGGNADGTDLRYEISPSAGDVAVFYQERLTPPTIVPPYELYHESSDVVSGDKYTCRCMVDYVFDTLEQASLSNIKDDASDVHAKSVVRGAPRVLAIGNTIIDTVVTMPQIPIDDKVWVDSKNTYVGGQGANCAQAMAMLGLNVSFLTRLGDDAHGSTARKQFANLSMRVYAPEAHGSTMSATVVVATETHQRTILMHRDRAVVDTDPKATLESLSVDDYDFVYTDGHQLDLVLPLVRAAVQRGLPVVADVEVIDDDARELARLATHLIAPRWVISTFACEHHAGVCGPLEEMLPALVDGSNRTVIATSGERGSLGASHGTGAVHFPAMAVNVKDTTGAGDAYHAGYVLALSRGLRLQDAMGLATRVAAAKVQTPGSVVSLEQLAKLGF